MEQSKIELAESLHQFVSTWRLLAKTAPQADLADKPGLAICWANVPFVFYNTLFLTEQISDARLLKERVRDACAYMRSHQAPGWIVICLDYLSGTATEELALITDQENLTSLIMTGMAGDILPLDESLHPTLRFERISDDDTIRDFVDMNCISYNIPIEAGRSIVKEHTLWHQHAFGFVAYEEERPVATATAIVNDGCLLLFLVATMPEVRRKGYADAVIRRALNTAHEATGIRRTVLHATDMGYPVYLRLGYYPTGRFMGYLPTADFTLAKHLCTAVALVEFALGICRQ
jgi:GNAT superfamily N-acetyltransferase